MDCTIYVHVLDFYFQAIAGFITVYILYFFLPTNGPFISSGLFCALEYSIYRIFPVDGLRISGGFKSCILPEFRSPSTRKIVKHFHLYVYEDEVA